MCQNRAVYAVSVKFNHCFIDKHGGINTERDISNRILDPPSSSPTNLSQDQWMCNDDEKIISDRVVR
jgi:hypothetical protein